MRIKKVRITKSNNPKATPCENLKPKAFVIGGGMGTLKTRILATMAVRTVTIVQIFNDRFHSISKRRLNKTASMTKKATNRNWLNNYSHSIVAGGFDVIS